MDTRLFGIDQSKRYGLELYGSDGMLIWKTGSDEPIPGMNVGDEVQALEARDADPSQFHVITSIRRVLWIASGQLHCTTRIQTRLGARAS